MLLLNKKYSYSGLSIWQRNRNFPLELPAVCVISLPRCSFWHCMLVSFSPSFSLVSLYQKLALWKSRKQYKRISQKFTDQCHATTFFYVFFLMCYSFSLPTFCFYYAIRIPCAACHSTTSFRLTLIFRTWYGCNMFFNLKRPLTRSLVRAHSSVMNKAKPPSVSAFFFGLLKYWRWIMWYCYDDARKKMFLNAFEKGTGAKKVKHWIKHKEIICNSEVNATMYAIGLQSMHCRHFESAFGVCVSRRIHYVLSIDTFHWWTTATNYQKNTLISFCDVP